MAKKALRLVTNGTKEYIVDSAEDWVPRIKKELNPMHFQLDDENGDYFSIDHWPEGRKISWEMIKEEGWQTDPCTWNSGTTYTKENGVVVTRGPSFSKGRRASGGSMKALLQEDDARLPEHLIPSYMNFFRSWKNKGDYSKEVTSLIGAIDRCADLTPEILQITNIAAIDYVRHAWKLGFKFNEEEELEIFQLLNKEVFNHTTVTL